MSECILISFIQSKDDREAMTILMGKLIGVADAWETSSSNLTYTTDILMAHEVIFNQATSAVVNYLSVG